MPRTLDKTDTIPFFKRTSLLISSQTLSRPTLGNALLAILAALITFAHGAAWSADVELKPILAVGGAYDDNIFMTRDDKVDSSIITVSPGIDLDYQTLLSNLSLKADWDILNYLDESDLDRTNHYYKLSGGHRFKERWDTSVDARYNKDTTLNSYLQEIGRVSERVEQDFFDAKARVAYNLTTISGISLGYQYQNSTYDSDRYEDYDKHTGSLYYYHRLKNELDTLSIGPSYSYRQNDLNDVESMSMDLGWKRNWSDVTRSDASIGARYTSVDKFDNEEDESWGAIARFNLFLKGQVASTSIRYFHDLRTTAEGDEVNVDNFYLSYRRWITERFSLGFNGRIVFSYKLFDEDSDINDSRYYWLEPRLAYQLTQHLDLLLKYRYQNNVDMLDEGDQTRERNIVWLELSYGFPFKL